MILSRSRYGCDHTCLFLQRQVSLNSTRKKMWKTVKQEQDKDRKLIHSKQHPKTWLSHVQGTNENTESKINTSLSLYFSSRTKIKRKRKRGSARMTSNYLSDPSVSLCCHEKKKKKITQVRTRNLHMCRSKG